MFNLEKNNSDIPLSLYVDYTIRHKILSGIFTYKTKFPIISKISANEDISERVIKEAYKRLSACGYIETVKRSGTYVSYKGDINSKSSYNRNFIYFQNTIESMYKNGFNRDDIFSCFYNALLSTTNKPAEILFVENDIFDLIQGKEELEKILGVNVQGLLLDVYEAKYEDFKNRIIVTTFKNFLRIKSLNGNTNIFPLKTTPHLEEFINFHEIPSNYKILYIATSLENKKILSKKYGYIKEIFANFELITPEEFNVSKSPDIIIGTEKIMQMIKPDNNAQKIILKRFYDNEGIAYIKEKLKQG